MGQKTNINPSKYNNIKRIADESPFAGERFAAKEKLRRMQAHEDPRLNDDQWQTIQGLRACGFKVTFEFGTGVSTASVMSTITS